MVKVMTVQKIYGRLQWLQSTPEVDVNGVKYFRPADTTPTKFTQKTQDADFSISASMELNAPLWTLKSLILFPKGPRKRIGLMSCGSTE